MGALVNSVMTVFVGTKVAPLPGRPLTTVGAVFKTDVVVVNWLVVLASALPERSVIWFVAATVRVAPAGSVEALSITVRLSREIVQPGLSGKSPLNRLRLL